MKRKRRLTPDSAWGVNVVLLLTAAGLLAVCVASVVGAMK